MVSSGSGQTEKSINENWAYGLGQCYGDITTGECTNCMYEARANLSQCFPSNGGMVFLDGCFLRLEDYDFLREENYTSGQHTICNNTSQGDGAFEASVSQAITKAIAAIDRNNYYAGVQNDSVSVLANCWRSLNSTQCTSCLTNANGFILKCLPSSEGRTLTTGCVLRYSSESFLNPRGEVYAYFARDRRFFLIAVVAAASIVGAVIGVCLWMCKKRISQGDWKGIISKFVRGHKDKTEDHMDIELFLKNNANLAPKRYRYSDLKKITNSFGDTLGKGGFGSVYKGKLHDGGLVAVKLLEESKGGSGEEFMNEVASISRTSHINIVTLLGFCFESSKRALIYEFMPNGSLDKFLSKTASSATQVQLGSQKLFEIAVGIARGLEYLHQGCNTRILHLDIKPHNILLDKDLKPKIADFGLAKLCPDRASIISMLGARGTVGYIAPEVFCRNFGDVSHKSDVYSFGMLVLEMVGARKKLDSSGVESSSDAYFPDWIYKQLEVNADMGVVDDTVDQDEIESVKRKLAVIGLWCVQTDPNQRPSISRVLEMLEGEAESLKVPPKPYLFSPTELAAESSSTLVSSF